MKNMRKTVGKTKTMKKRVNRGRKSKTLIKKYKFFGGGIECPFCKENMVEKYKHGNGNSYRCENKDCHTLFQKNHVGMYCSSIGEKTLCLSM